MNARITGFVISLIVCLSLVDCNQSDSPDSVAQDTAVQETTAQDTLKWGIETLEATPREWRSVLERMISQLESTTPEVAGRIVTLLNDAEALIALQPTCNTDYLGESIKANLVYIRNEFLGLEQRYPDPWVCLFVPDQVNLGWRSDHWQTQDPVVNVYGFNFASSNPPRVEVHHPEGGSYWIGGVELVPQTTYASYLDLQQLQFQGSAEADVSNLIYKLSLQWPNSRGQEYIALKFSPPEFEMIVEISLEAIRVIDEADGSGDAEPYLWPVFFKLDGHTLENLYYPSGNWVYGPGGAHGNIGGPWDAGDYILIPPRVGHWQTTLRGYPSWLPREQASVAVLVVLLEQDHLPSSSSIVNEHYPTFVTKITEQIQCQIRSHMPGWLRGIHEITHSLMCPTSSAGSSVSTGADAIEEVERQLQTQLKEKLQAPWTVWFLGPFRGAVDADDFIGTGLFMWTWEDLERQPIQTFWRTWDESTGSEDGAFTISGSIRAEIVTR